jgi:hypothetical protein
LALNYEFRVLIERLDAATVWRWQEYELKNAEVVKPESGN